jgi:hypothetical protein
MYTAVIGLILIKSLGDVLSVWGTPSSTDIVEWIQCNGEMKIIASVGAERHDSSHGATLLKLVNY